MEMWAEIRRRVLTGAISKRQACQEYKIHWATLKKILGNSEPPAFRKPPKRPGKIDSFRPIIEQILKDDRTAPRKQTHTAHRIWKRLRTEHGYTGGYTSVKNLLRVIEIENKEVFLPLIHPPGEAQVDYGFADIEVNGVLTKIALFVMSLPHSDAVYVRAYPRECAETFADGHVQAFQFYGGVPKRIAYDNTKTAVAEILQRRERRLSQEFARLKSHYVFDAHFCLVRRPNEKGHVERLLDYARSNFLVPVPKVSSLAELNAKLEEECRRDLDRPVRGKSGTAKELLVEDQQGFLPCPTRHFETRRIKPVHANGMSTIQFETNSYSVPSKFARRKLTVVATIDEVRIIHEDKLIARHPRCWDREKPIHDPIHYLAVLDRKPGGLDFAQPLEKWGLPDCFALLRKRLEADNPDQGTRHYIKVLRLLERFSIEQTADAISYAVDIDVIDPDSIRSILEARLQAPVKLFPLDGRPHLAGVHVPPTDVSAYRDLLPGGVS